MVLEDLPSDPDPYFTPSSSEDPFPSAPSTISSSSYDLTTLPQPLPFSSFWGYTPTRLSTGITFEIQLIVGLLHRPLTHDESSAVAYHYARGFRYASLGTPAGIIAGLYAVQKTSPFKPGGDIAGEGAGGREIRFPFSRFLIPDKGRKLHWLEEEGGGGVLRWGAKELGRGAGVKNAIIGLRAGLYVGFGVVAGLMVFGSYGATVAAVGSAVDKRLGSLREVLQQESKRREVERRTSGGEETKKRRDSTGQGQRTAGELWKNHRGAIGDDASPTAAGVDSDDFMAGSGGDDSSYMKTASQSPTRERRQPRRNRASALERETPSPQSTDFSADYTSSTPSPSSTDFATDYTPSTPSSSSTSYTTSTPAENTGESAWERVRRENSSADSSSSSPSTNRNKRRGPRGGRQEEPQDGADSFTFSRATEERNYAKDEAQKRFDERVERERRDENDSGAGNAGRGW